jgi:hypothetical protein
MSLFLCYVLHKVFLIRIIYSQIYLHIRYIGNPNNVLSLKIFNIQYK